MRRQTAFDSSLRFRGVTLPVSLSLAYVSLAIPSSESYCICDISNFVHSFSPHRQRKAEKETSRTSFVYSAKPFVYFGHCLYDWFSGDCPLSHSAGLTSAYIRSHLGKALDRFNRLVRRHCDRVPLGLASLSQKTFRNQGERIGHEGREIEMENLVAGDKQRTILILMSDTGGGHRASAEAIKATFELEYGDQYKVIITDLWSEHTPWPFNQLPKSYSFLVKHGTLWKAAFHGSAPQIVHQSHFAMTSPFIARKVVRGLLKHRPDVIVSVHPLMQHVPLRILKARGLLNKIPFTTVITDLSTGHPTWFHRLVTKCFCPTREVADRALKAGLRSSQIRVHGLPIRPSFCRAIRTKVELHRELGMDEDLPAVLLMGGGEGMGPVEATAKALGESLYDERGGKATGQLVIICGNNKKLKKRLQSIDWSPIPVQVRGFETKMEQWMGACDCIITKAGPGTIAEAMICGLPLLLNGYIAGQETGNVPFVVDNGVGKFCKDPSQIAKIVAEWFGPKAEELQRMSQNALKLARPDAVFKIVHDLDELARQKEDLPKFAMALA